MIVFFRRGTAMPKKKKKKDTELKINYGTEAGTINRLMHKTMPSFC